MNKELRKLIVANPQAELLFIATDKNPQVVTSGIMYGNLINCNKFQLTQGIKFNNKIYLSEYVFENELFEYLAKGSGWEKFKNLTEEEVNRAIHKIGITYKREPFIVIYFGNKVENAYHQIIVE